VRPRHTVLVYLIYFRNTEQVHSPEYVVDDSLNGGEMNGGEMNGGENTDHEIETNGRQTDDAINDFAKYSLFSYLATKLVKDKCATKKAKYILN